MTQWKQNCTVRTAPAHHYTYSINTGWYDWSLKATHHGSTEPQTTWSTLHHLILQITAFIVTTVLPTFIQLIQGRLVKEPYHTSILTGQGWVDELINGHPNRIWAELGMKSDVFLALISKLRELGYADSKYVSLEEQPFFYMHQLQALQFAILANGFKDPMKLFQSITLSIFICIEITYYFSFGYFQKMTKIFSHAPFYTDYVKQLTPADNPSQYIIENPKLRHFSKALGAIDGSHIHVSPPRFMLDSCCNRKGFLSQNCLFCSSFDFLFTYSLTGWEGSAADARIYGDAIRTDLNVPDGWYFLADAGFPHCKELLVPYQGIRYHLHERGKANLRYLFSN